MSRHGSGPPSGWSTGGDQVPADSRQAFEHERLYLNELPDISPRRTKNIAEARTSMATWPSPPTTTGSPAVAGRK
jgi:hypothetical protein